MANAAITVDLNARIAQFETELKRAGASLDGFAKKGNSALASLKTFGAGFAGALSVGAITAFAKSGIDAADALNDMSQRLGVSVKDLASFKLAAEQSGTSLDGVGVGIARLSRSIGEAEGGNKKLAAALSTLGVTARDPKEAFFQLADAVQRVQDPSQRAALLSQVLGKSYQELVPLLAQGGAELRKSAVASESFADAMARLAPEADKFNDELAELKNNAAAAAAQGLLPLVEALNLTIERIERLKQLRGAGATILEIVTGSVSADTGASLQRVNGDIKDIESTIARLRKNSGGRDSSIATLTADLERLKGVRAELRKQSMDGALALAAKYGNYKVPGTPEQKSGTKVDFSKALGGGGGAKKDPFAAISGLLSNTDAGRLADFDKKVALLNQRFAGGRKDTEQYTQAMTALIETTFANNFRQAADDAEFMNMVMDDGQATISEANQNMRDWQDTVASTQRELIDMLDPVNALVRQLTELDKFDGFIDPEVLAAARLELNAQIDALGTAKDKIGELDTFAKNAAEGMQDAFADFLFDPFADGLDGMLQGFGTMIQRMIAEAVAADLARNLFGSLVEGGSGDGLVGGALTAIGGLLGFDGGGYTGDGARSGGLDGKGGFLAVMHPRETVVDHTRGQGMGGNTIVVNVSGGSAPDVRRAAAQGAREALGMLEGARRYG